MVTLSRRLGAKFHDAELPSTICAEHLVFMPAVRPHCWTMEEVETLMEQREGHTPRYELVDGELLVTPAPNNRHQRIVKVLLLLLDPYVRLHRLGEVAVSPGTVALTPHTRFEPDVYVVPAVGGRLPRWKDPVTQLLLAAEVLSPSSARHDRITKRQFFMAHGVPDYWVVDGDAEAFEVWKPGNDRPALVDDRLTWQPNAFIPAFEFDVRAFFASVADEDEPLTER